MVFEKSGLVIKFKKEDIETIEAMKKMVEAINETIDDSGFDTWVSLDSDEIKLVDETGHYNDVQLYNIFDKIYSVLSDLI